MKHLLFIIALLLTQSVVHSQLNDSMEMKPRAKAILLINELKEGVLLVRLHTKSSGIEALKKKGQMEQAEKVRSYQEKENLEIMNAFRQFFTFCPVYFFFSDSSAALEREVPHHFFLDENLEMDPSIQFSESFYLVAQKGDLRFKAEEGKAPANGLLKNVLVVLDASYIQLRDPFPHYAKGKHWAWRVRKLDTALFEFYEEAN